MRKQVKMLEHHADILTRFVDVRLRIVQILVINDDTACSDVLKPIDAAQKRTFPRSGRTDHAYDFAFLHLHIDSFQHLIGAEALL